MKTEDVFIREYTRADKAAVMQLFILNTPRYFSMEEEAGFLEYLDAKVEKYFVMEVEQVIAGAGGINYSDDCATGVISWDMLHPDYQGRGLGRRLLEYRISMLKNTEGIQRITVRTSQLTYRFYEKSGFQIRETVKDYWAKGFDLCFMEYRMSPSN